MTSPSRTRACRAIANYTLADNTVGVRIDGPRNSYIGGTHRRLHQRGDRARARRGRHRGGQQPDLRGRRPRRAQQRGHRHGDRQQHHQEPLPGRHPRRRSLVRRLRTEQRARSERYFAGLLRQQGVLDGVEIGVYGGAVGKTVVDYNNAHHYNNNSPEIYAWNTPMCSPRSGPPPARPHTTARRGRPGTTSTRRTRPPPVTRPSPAAARRASTIRACRTPAPARSRTPTVAPWKPSGARRCGSTSP